MYALRKYKTGEVGWFDKQYDRIFVHLKHPDSAFDSILIEDREEALALFHLIGNYLLSPEPTELPDPEDER